MKEQLEIELNQLMTELCILEEKAKLGRDTVEFLGKETDKLLSKSQDQTLSFEERERVYNQMTTLQSRLNREKEMLIADMNELSKLNPRLEHFQSLILGMI